MYYAIYETKAHISLYTWAVGEFISNFNSGYENKFSFEPGHGHEISRLCIRLLVFPHTLHIKVVSILEK